MVVQETRHLSPLLFTKAIKLHILQIVPNLPPRVDGIGDYAVQLARSLRTDLGVNTSFLVCDPAWKGYEVEGFTALSLKECSPNAFLEALRRVQQDAGTGALEILLHFAPYGYEKRGYPLWLSHALQSLSKQASSRLSTLFHELDVRSMRPWSSAFWVAPLQRRLIHEIGQLSQSIFTNTPDHLNRLGDLGASNISLISNFSTVGEPCDIPLMMERRRELIIFGRAGQREWSYQRGSSALQRLCTHLEIERVIDVGPSLSGDSREEVAGRPLVRRGVLSADAVSCLMRESIGTFLHYPLTYLPKSSIHAVASAHGAIPFVHGASETPGSARSLLPGEDYVHVTLDNKLPAIHDLDGISSRIFARYQGRSSHVAARTIHGLLLSA